MKNKYKHELTSLRSNTKAPILGKFVTKNGKQGNLKHFEQDVVKKFSSTGTGKPPTLKQKHSLSLDIQLFFAT